MHRDLKTRCNPCLFCVLYFLYLTQLISSLLPKNTMTTLPGVTLVFNFENHGIHATDSQNSPSFNRMDVTSLSSLITNYQSPQKITIRRLRVRQTKFLINCHCDRSKQTQPLMMPLTEHSMKRRTRSLARHLTDARLDLIVKTVMGPTDLPVTCQKMEMVPTEPPIKHYQCRGKTARTDQFRTLPSYPFLLTSPKFLQTCPPDHPRNN